LRDYEAEGQIGLEPTFQEYLTKLVTIFDEVKRVLRRDGTCWVVIGDVYSGSGCGKNDYRAEENKSISGVGKNKNLYKTNGIAQKIKDIPAKSLIQIPARFAIMMIEHNWILRNDIIWHKPNAMPSSVKDRFTVDYEHVYFFTKSNKTQFWTNSKTGACVSKRPLGIKGIEGIDWEYREIGNDYSSSDTKINSDIAESLGSPRARKYRDKKLKKVSLWTGHDYYFEQQIEEYAESSEARMKYPRYAENSKGESGQYAVVSNKYKVNKGRNKRCVWSIPTKPFKGTHFATFPPDLVEPMIKAGCPEGGIVLDPFFGSGTVGLVARKLKRNFIGIEINPEYCKMAEERLQKAGGKDNSKEI